MTQRIGAGLFSCADKIWETADTVRGAGIKASDWPAYMMPFFALMMLESRSRRIWQGRIDEFKRENASSFSFEDAAHLEWPWNTPPRPPTKGFTMSTAADAGNVEEAP